MALPILIALAATAGQAPMHINRLPGPLGRVEGPRDVCTEHFSVRLGPGEAVSWSDRGDGNVFYRLHAGGADLNVGPWLGTLPVEGRVEELSLAGSPVAQRRVHPTDTVRVSTKGSSARPRPVRAWAVEYLLYGRNRHARPLTISTYTSDPNLYLAIAERVTLGSMEERGCRTPTRIERGAVPPSPPSGR
jgi:hypothetical protein